MHEIKGYPNATCDAVMALNAEYRWGLTGTPTPNGIEELYPYLSFIGHPKITTIREYRKEYVGGKKRNVISEEVRFERLRELLAPVMIMRTPSHSFLGTTLLRLPVGHPLPPIKVQLSPEEKIIYRFIDKRIQDHTEKKATDKGRDMDLHMLNESLVRLRQCVTCPLLLGNLVREGFWNADGIASMRQQALEAGCQNTPFIDHIERWMLSTNIRQASTPSGSTLQEKSIADAMALLDTSTCPGNKCGQVITNLIEPQMSECGHVWCKSCLEQQIKIENFLDEKKPPECSRCRKPLGQAKPYSAAEHSGEPSGAAPTSKRRQGDDYNGKQPRSSNMVDLLDRDPTLKVPRSAKVDAVVRQIVAWLNEAPEDKIIVFIQWVELNGILGRLLQEEGIEFLYYTGTTEMKDKDRKAAIDTFKQDPYVKVLICSLRCGGQALNLTCANRTIMVDLWWNHSVEAQATARVYRMGQQKETYSVRVIVEDSVDNRVYELQEKKLQSLQNAYQEFEADKNLDTETVYELLGWQHSEGETLSDEDGLGDDDGPDDPNDSEYTD
ncbi:DNA repair protein rad5 [Cytospora mali]|uniref:DNA repair protein rad5 n=1 Tax=Cytospora mali TaxID=578113 RepID=A0A194VHN1_CYTMA|nr:DNA repair protein rad5 [Valsa mali]